MAFDLGSKFTHGTKQYTEDAVGKALGNDP